MKLFIDIGNTAIKFVEAKGDILDFIARFYTKEISIEKLDEIFKSHFKYDEVVISSVVPKVNKLMKEYFVSKYHLEPRFIKVGDYPDIKIDIDNPKELGTDLYCDIIAGYQLAKIAHKPVIVIDLGTASKMMLIYENGLFNSCVIIPGIEMSKKMLSSETAQLPLSEIDEIKKVTEARNTLEVINSSVYYGHVEAINGLINRIEKEIKKSCHIIITGGNSEIIEKDIKGPHDVNPLMCFYGIYEIVK